MLIKLLLVTATFGVFQLRAGAYSLYDELDQSIGPVYFTNIAYRHGQRTPMEELPGLELSYRANYQLAMGELTKQGMRTHYRLGAWLRERYDNLIPKVGYFQTSLLSVLSCTLDRTIQSAMSNLAGMFPPTPDQKWMDGVGFVPVPIRTVDDSLDKFFDLPRTSCKKWANEYKRFIQTDEYKNFSGQYSWVLNSSMRVFNSTFNQTDPLILGNLLFGAMAFPIADASLPMSAEERAFIDSVNEPNMAYFHSFTYTDIMRRLVGGPLLKEMIDNMLEAVAAKPIPTKRFAIYSGKDNTLAPLLFTMGIKKGLKKSPLYASTVLMELRLSSNNVAYVTVLFKNSYDESEEPKLLEIPLCPHPCRLDTLATVMLPFMPSDWETECNEE